MTENNETLRPDLSLNGTEDPRRQGTILDADDTFETVNKVARRGLWPHSKIRKVKGHTASNDLHYAVEIEDADGHWHLASKPGRLLSPQYLLVPNEELKAMAHEVARLTGYAWKPYREYFDGTRYQYMLVSEDFQREVVPGDPVRAAIRAQQSYDGMQRAATEVFVERLVCGNGMLTSDRLFSFAFEHRLSDNGGAAAWKQELERAGYEIRHLSVNFGRFVDELIRLHELPVGHEEMRRFTEALPAAFPSSTYGEIVRRFYAHEEATGFGLLNAATYVTWHQGEKTTVQDYRRNEQLVELLVGFTASG
jgi:hypothetical protein